MAPGTSLRSFFARFAIALVAVVACAGVAVAFGNGEVEDSFNDIEVQPIRPDALDLPDPGGPQNFLVVGTDSRAFVETEGEQQLFGTADEVGGQRSDAIMVVHIDPHAAAGFVVSFPRDLWVDIPGHGSGRLNSAIGYGDASLIIDTINENFHIPINHYLELDFAGFQKIVDTIGSVNIWFPTPAKDEVSALNIPEAGCRSLNGADALAYVRARHYQWYDAEAGKWRMDPRSDLSRIERQQYFVRSLAQTALDRGARNLTTAFALLDDMSDALKRDPNLTVKDLKALINAFRDVNPADIEMVTLPVDRANKGGADVVVPHEPDADAVLSRLWLGGMPQGLPPMAAPADTTVHVLNGSGEKGRAAEVQQMFEAAGFRTVGEPGDADRDDYPVTQVRWEPGKGGEALAVVAALGAPSAAEAGPDDELGGADVLVIVGRDWDALAAPVKEGAAAPSTEAPTTGPSGTTTAPATTTTVTTAPPTTPPSTQPPSPSATAVVPVDPETGGTLVGCP
ncbi:MAG TPA: LCP family protein [Acidimicrobiia bacterium]|nr:LCP family protein [Acidimicrobiia bacterium]